MTKEEFIAACKEKDPVATEIVIKVFGEPQLCNCGESICQGWKWDISTPLTREQGKIFEQIIKEVQ